MKFVRVFFIHCENNEFLNFLVSGTGFALQFVGGVIMEDRTEKRDSILRGIFCIFFVAFALVASFVPGGLLWTAVVGVIFLTGFVFTIHDSLSQVEEPNCSMCVFHCEGRCELKNTLVSGESAVCTDFVLRRHRQAA